MAKRTKKGQLQSLVQDLVGRVESVNGVSLIAQSLDLSIEALKSCADDVAAKLLSGVVALATTEQGKCHLILRVSDDLVKKGVKAGDLVKAVAPLIDGSGGGKPNQAQAGGKSPEGLPAALNKIRELVASIG